MEPPKETTLPTHGRTKSGGPASPVGRSSVGRVQLTIIALLLLGCASMFIRMNNLTFQSPITTGKQITLSETHATNAPTINENVQLEGQATAAAIVTSAPTPIEKKALPQFAATPSPYKYKDDKTAQMCYKQRDFGLLEEIRVSYKSFCMETGFSRADVHDHKSTQVTVYRVNGGIRSTVFVNLTLDMSDVGITHPIKSLAEDGGDHDPRFKFNPHMVHCACDELKPFLEEKHLRLWDPSITGLPHGDHDSTMCAAKSTVVKPTNNPKKGTTTEKPLVPPLKEPEEGVIVFTQPIFLMTRRDDHNPFFQISNTLNTWIMAQALGWDLQQTRLVHFDAGYPSPVDALHQKLLSPNFEVVNGTLLMNKQVRFESSVMITPYEVSGPMMQHLDDTEPCYDSQLLKTFRYIALETMGLNDDIQRAPYTNVRPMVVTVITRRAYSGRKVNRVWLNEDEVFEEMRKQYSELNIIFQSVDFVLLTIEDQMKTILNSDIVIGMHGAGMVNVFWTRPETLVVEIFPARKKRWGYRNMCQFVGCNWHEFRGGIDVGGFHDNASDKKIPYNEWHNFFDKHLREQYSSHSQQQEALQKELESRRMALRNTNNIEEGTANGRI